MDSFFRIGKQNTNQLTENEWCIRILEARKAIAEGKLVSHEEVKEYFKRRSKLKNGS